MAEYLVSYDSGNILEETPDLLIEAGETAPALGNADVPAAPTGLTVSINKYDVSVSWAQVAAPAGVDVSYEVKSDGHVFATTSSQYTLKNAAVGSHVFAVRAVFSNNTATAWTADAAAEVKDITAPKAGKVTLTQTGADSVKVAWTEASDNVGVTQYLVTCGGQTREVDGNALSETFTGVSGKLEAAVIACDAAGNASKAAKKSITLKDVTPPTQVVGLASKGVDNKSGGTLAWSASTDNVGVTQYLVTVDGKTVYKSKTTSVKIKKLAAGSHTFSVVAVDKAKNQSAASAAAAFTVDDVIAPKIKKLSAKVTGETAKVTWQATDETALGTLKLAVDGAALDVTGLSSYDLDLAAGTHKLRFEAFDAAGNMAFKEVSVKVKESKKSAAGLLASVA